MKTKLLFILFFPFIVFAQMSDADYKKALDILFSNDQQKGMLTVENAEKKYPNTDKTLILRGIYQSRNRKDFDALAIYSKAIQMNPKFPDAYQLRGEKFFDKGIYRRAIADITKAIELEPTEVDMIISRVKYYLANNQLKEALEDTKTRIRLKSNDYNAYLDAAIISKKLDPNYDADSFFKQSYAAKGNTKYQTDLVFGNFLIGSGRFEEARTKYESALALAEKYLVAEDFHNLAMTYYKTKMYEKAIIYYNKAINMSPNDTVYLNNLNSVYNTQRNYEMQKIIAKRVLDINLDDVWGNKNMAIGLANTGQETLANEYNEKAIRLHKEQNP